MYVRRYVCVYVCVCMCVCMYVCMYGINVYIYICDAYPPVIKHSNGHAWLPEVHSYGKRPFYRWFVMMYLLKWMIFDSNVREVDVKYSIQYLLISLSMIHWLVVFTILKNISQWEGLSHILWKIKNVPNHQSVHHSKKRFPLWNPIEIPRNSQISPNSQLHFALQPSLKMARARTVAVVVPSPATSFVLLATWVRNSWCVERLQNAGWT